jgi:hypothetical protein
MSEVASPPVVSMLAWWDPKDRTLIFDPGSAVPGMLCVGPESIAFLTPDAWVFDGLLRETALSMKGFWQASSCSFRITCNGTAYRMYLSPRKGARKLSGDQLEAIEGALNAMSAAGRLMGRSMAGSSGVFGLMGNVVQTHSVMTSLRRARRNYKLLQERVSGAGGIQVS